MHVQSLRFLNVCFQSHIYPVFPLTSVHAPDSSLRAVFSILYFWKMWREPSEETVKP